MVGSCPGTRPIARPSLKNAASLDCCPPTSRSIFSSKLQTQWQGLVATKSVGNVLASGNVADLIEWDGRLLKLYRSHAAKASVFREAASHARAEELGLPVPAIWGVAKVGSLWGLILDRVDPRTFADRMQAEPSEADRYMQALARIQAQIHAQPGKGFPALKDRLTARLTRVAGLAQGQREVLLRGLRGMPDGNDLCHGDFHPRNVLGEPEQPIVIDWPDACCGDRAADICRTYFVLLLHAEEFARAYLDINCRMNDRTSREILAWLPYLAAVRLDEDVIGERDRLMALLEDTLPIIDDTAASS